MNDEFILRIILDKKPEFKQNKDQKFKQDHTKYLNYLKPIMTKEFLQHSTQRSPFKLSTENLFEIIYSVIGQMFLSKIETIDNLMFELKKKFPNQNYVMNEHYVNAAKE
jgi:hypothetical protein